MHRYFSQYPVFKQSGEKFAPYRRARMSAAKGEVQAVNRQLLRRLSFYFSCYFSVGCSSMSVSIFNFGHGRNFGACTFNSRFISVCTYATQIRRRQRHKTDKTVKMLNEQKQSFCTCVLNFGKFRCHPLQNNNLK